MNYNAATLNKFCCWTGHLYTGSLQPNKLLIVEIGLFNGTLIMSRPFNSSYLKSEKQEDSVELECNTPTEVSWSCLQYFRFVDFSKHQRKICFGPFHGQVCLRFCITEAVHLLRVNIYENTNCEPTVLDPRHYRAECNRHSWSDRTGNMGKKKNAPELMLLNKGISWRGGKQIPMNQLPYWNTTLV